MDSLLGAIWHPQGAADLWLAYTAGSVLGLGIAFFGAFFGSLESTIFGTALMYWFVQRSKSMEGELA